MSTALLSESPWEGRVLLGDWVPAHGGTARVIEPATGSTLGSVGQATAEDVRIAAQTAAGAQRDWAAAPYVERAAVLRRAGDLWQRHSAEIARWLVREAGSVPAKAELEIAQAAQECYEASAVAAVPNGEVLPSQQPRLSFAQRMPVGVVGVIAPYNFPITLAIRAVAPALALGNAVILKPDPRTAVSGGVVLGMIFAAAGLPPGVLSVLPGDADTGIALVEDPDVPVIAFTGSTRAGRAVATAAARKLKRTHLELGGNSAFIVLEDADVEAAATAGAFGSWFHAGQICMAAGRHLVHRSISAQYTALLAAKAEKLRVGDPATDPVDLGPLIDARQRDAVHRFVSDTVAAGATLVTGGVHDGLFYRPTVLADVPPDSPAATSEIFGPVAPVLSYSTVDEAVAIARAGEYGLALGIVTRDVMRGLEIADRIPTGLVHINDQTVNDEAVVPFGGIGDSGTGTRHGGHRANIEAFTETRWTTLRSSPPTYPY
ncbi:benzaldehyde dehydrogenase [Nocardia sp. NBC_00508]|nr:benzaldehyde dehydrogenase [Nocardia sp. NBC_00508]WUD70192.1 benzaldehyde dehydrogenase [Nocardia sp. NBC_00508]